MGYSPHLLRPASTLLFKHCIHASIFRATAAAQAGLDGQGSRLETDMLNDITVKKFKRVTTQQTSPGLMSVSNFKAVTNVTGVLSGVRRQQETILTTVDDLLAEFHSPSARAGRAGHSSTKSHSSAKSVLLLARMYYALDRWLLLASREDKSVNTRRGKGVQKLYTQVANTLAYHVGVPINTLPNWLALNFTQAMGNHGEEDFTAKNANYYNAKTREQYRLNIVNGCIYQKMWWTADKADQWVPANSEVTQSTGSKNTISETYCGYVLSVQGDFYAGPHKTGTRLGREGQYHSSYMAGEPVLCAGEIKIVDGVVINLSTASGHYAPGDDKLVNVIYALALCGVSPDTYTVTPHRKASVNAKHYLQQRVVIDANEVLSGTREIVNHYRGENRVRRLNPVRAQLQAKILKLEKALKYAQHRSTHGPRPPRGCPTCKALSKGEDTIALLKKLAKTGAADLQNIDQVLGRIQ